MDVLGGYVFRGGKEGQRPLMSYLTSKRPGIGTGEGRADPTTGQVPEGAFKYWDRHVDGLVTSMAKSVGGDANGATLFRSDDVNGVAVYELRVKSHDSSLPITMRLTSDMIENYALSPTGRAAAGAVKTERSK